MATEVQPWRVPAFGAIAAAFLAVEWTVVHSAAFAQSRLFPVAVLIDLAIVLPLVYYALVLRPIGKPWQNTFPLVALGAFGSALLFGDQASARTLALVAGGLAELLLLGLAISGLRSAIGSFRQTAPDQSDLLLRLEALDVSLPLKLAAAELALFYYAFVGPRVPTPKSETTFSYTEKSSLGGLLFAFGFLTVVEGLVVHVLLHQWSLVAAILFSLFHLYTLLWLIAFHQAARLRPHAVTETDLLVRVGLLWTALVPYDSIATITPLTELPETRDAAFLGTIPGLEPALLLTLTRPIEVRGPLGIWRKVTQIALAVDEPARFNARLSSSVS